MKLVNVNPVYPASMRAAGRSGVVPLDALIDRRHRRLRPRRQRQRAPRFRRRGGRSRASVEVQPDAAQWQAGRSLMTATINFSLDEGCLNDNARRSNDPTIWKPFAWLDR